jgi:hypothetical protein
MISFIESVHEYINNSAAVSPSIMAKQYSFFKSHGIEINNKERSEVHTNTRKI